MTSSPSPADHALEYSEQQVSSFNATSVAQSNENFLFSDSGLSSLVEISVAVVGDEEGLKKQEWSHVIDKERLASLSPNKPSVSSSNALSPSRPSITSSRNSKKRSFEQLQLQFSSNISPKHNKRNVSNGNSLHSNGHSVSSSSDETPKKKKPCNCKNSKCLKLYCECFSAQLFCDSSCNCVGCFNKREHEQMVRKARNSTLERNPSAFKPKINSPKSGVGTDIGKHSKGCHCKKSNCLKRYCECFQANVLCSDNCKCVDCKNFLGNEERQAAIDSNDSPPNIKTNYFEQSSSSANDVLRNSARQVMTSLVQKPIVSNLCSVLLLGAMDAAKEMSSQKENRVEVNSGSELSEGQLFHSQTETRTPIDNNSLLMIYRAQEKSVLLEFSKFLKRAEDILQKNAEYVQNSAATCNTDSPKTQPKQAKRALLFSPNTASLVP